METIRTYTSLTIYHDEMSVDEMLEILEYEPDDSKDNSGLQCKPSICSYTTNYELESISLDEHLEYLISNLQDLFDKVKHNNKYGFDARVAVFWDTPFDNGGDGPHLSAKYLKFLGGLGIDMWFDFWYTVDCDE